MFFYDKAFLHHPIIVSIDKWSLYTGGFTDWFQSIHQINLHSIVSIHKWSLYTGGKGSVGHVSLYDLMRPDFFGAMCSKHVVCVVF